MAKIAILGAGVMGSALSVPASAANSITLIGSPLDEHIIHCLRDTGKHPVLDVALPGSLSYSLSSDQNQAALCGADIIVIGVSSPGVDWAIDEIQRSNATPDLLALVTKGLVPGPVTTAAPQTYAQYINSQMTSPAGRIVGIGGPCIARELAMAYPTRVSFAAHDISCADKLRDLMQTDYYRITTHTDFTGLEACAALKNFMCIGVSAMLSAYQLDDSHAKNPLAALFNQAVHEIALLSQWIVSSTGNRGSTVSEDDHRQLTIPTAFDLAGMGDLHVTVGGGRNSRLGKHLGNGERLTQIQNTTMRGVTVEGVDTGRQLLSGFRAACDSGVLDASTLPLTEAILACIALDEPFNFDFSLLPG